MPYEDNLMAYDYIFRLQAFCVTDHILRYWKPRPTCNFWKIKINCFNTNEEIKLYNNKHSDIFQIGCSFDYKYFFNLNNKEKKIFLLSVIEENVLKALEELNLSTIEFKNACEEVREEDYLNIGLFAKKKNADGLLAQILAIHDVLDFRLYFLIKDKKKNLLFKQEIEIELPRSERFVSLQGKLVWDKNKAIYTTRRKTAYTVDIDNNFALEKTVLEDNYFTSKKFTELSKRNLIIVNSTLDDICTIVDIKAKQNVEFIVPETVVPDNVERFFEVKFHVTKFFWKSVIKVIGNNETLISYKRKSILPILTEEIKIPKFIFDNKEIKEIFISVEECL